MGLAIASRLITFGANVQDVTVPALLVAGELDTSQAAFDKLASTEKALVLIPKAKHRHFESGMCAQTQSSGAIAAANPTRAILDLETVSALLIFPSSGVAMDSCGFETFTNPQRHPTSGCLTDRVQRHS
jgi:hypothetical protein